MRISTVEQLLDLLDTLTPDRDDATSRAAADAWTRVLGTPGHPLSTDLPDVNLVAWARRGLLPAGAGRTALDVGCGLGRHAGWLARAGWDAVGIDVSTAALAAARERHPARFADVDVLRDPLPAPGTFDLVYDSGCFHHLAPHRRITYLATVVRAVVPGGLFGVCTFAAGEMGSDLDDAALLVSGRFGDGVGYTTDDLVDIFAGLDLIDAVAHSDLDDDGASFRQPFLTAALFRRPR